MHAVYEGGPSEKDRAMYRCHFKSNNTNAGEGGRHLLNSVHIILFNLKKLLF